MTTAAITTINSKKDILSPGKNQNGIKNSGKTLPYNRRGTKHYLLFNLEILMEAMQKHHVGDNEITAASIIKESEHQSIIQLAQFAGIDIPILNTQYAIV